MSSRFIPPKLPDILYIVSTISSVSAEFMQIGNASTLPNSLKSAHLPSITGIPASAPIFPSPSTAEPSVTTAIRLERLVYKKDFSGFLCISRHGSATPGVYASERSFAVLSSARGTISIFPCHSICFFNAFSFISITVSVLCFLLVFQNQVNLT